jgi:hypothetical protein
MASSKDISNRLKGALWGMFIGDALAMPVHWYYNTASLKNDYGEGLNYIINTLHFNNEISHKLHGTEASASRFNPLEI